MAADPRSTLIRNEQVKSRAGLLNAYAGSCLVAGSLTPAGLFLFGSAPTRAHWWLLVLGVPMLFIVAAAFHAAALRVLEDLDA